MDPEIQEHLRAFLKKKGLRQTSHRDKIVTHIFESAEHFTPDELFDRLKSAGLRPSRATLYRTILLLTEAGLLQEIDLGDGRTTYDPNFHAKPSHNHLVCIDCGLVREFENEELDRQHQIVSDALGFTPVKASLRLEAACQQLRANTTCPNLIKARVSKKRLPTRKR